MKRIVFHESYKTLNSTAPVCRELNWELGIFENLTSLGTVCFGQCVLDTSMLEIGEELLRSFSWFSPDCLEVLASSSKGIRVYQFCILFIQKDEMEPSAALKKCYYGLLKNFVRDSNSNIKKNF